MKPDDRQDAYPTYADIAGFCKSAKTVEFAEHGSVLTPGRYVGAEEAETPETHRCWNDSTTDSGSWPSGNAVRSDGEQIWTSP